MKPWLTIIGIGEDGWEGLSAKAREAIHCDRNISSVPPAHLPCCPLQLPKRMNGRNPSPPLLNN